MFVQHLPSIMVARQLNPQPGERILDMCAAPGGKTLHIATLMKNTGEVIALDKVKSKVQQIRDTCNLQGITCVKAYAMDSTKLLGFKDMHGLGQSVSVNFDEGSFDRILLDPPCSGLGQRPRFKEMMPLVDLKSASQYQQRLINVAYRLLKPGGVLVYSTCTINPEENEGNVCYALSSFPDLELVHTSPYLGEKALDLEMHGYKMSDEQRGFIQRFDPSVPLDTIGFFIAKFMKNT